MTMRTNAAAVTTTRMNITTTIMTMRTSVAVDMTTRMNITIIMTANAAVAADTITATRSRRRVS